MNSENIFVKVLTFGSFENTELLKWRKLGNILQTL